MLPNRGPCKEEFVDGSTAADGLAADTVFNRAEWHFCSEKCETEREAYSVFQEMCNRFK